MDKILVSMLIFLALEIVTIVILTYLLLTKGGY